MYNTRHKLNMYMYEILAKVGITKTMFIHIIYAYNNE